MTDTKPPPTPVPDDDAKKRLRDKVDKLLAAAPHKSESSITLDGKTFNYSAVAAFVPVTAGGVDDKRGDPEAAIFTTSYFLADADPRTRPVCFASTAARARRRSGCIWARWGRSVSSSARTGRCRRRPTR